MKLKLDENLGRRGSSLLAAEGHDVATVVHERLAGAPDRLLRPTPPPPAVAYTDGSCLGNPGPGG